MFTKCSIFNWIVFLYLVICCWCIKYQRQAAAARHLSSNGVAEDDKEEEEESIEQESIGNVTATNRNEREIN